MAKQTDRKATRFTWHLSPDLGWGEPRQVGNGTALNHAGHGRDDGPAFWVPGWDREARGIFSALTDADIPTKAQALEAMEELAARGCGEVMVRVGARVWLVTLDDPE